MSNTWNQGQEETSSESQMPRIIRAPQQAQIPQKPEKNRGPLMVVLSVVTFLAGLAIVLGAVGIFLSIQQAKLNKTDASMKAESSADTDLSQVTVEEEAADDSETQVPEENGSEEESAEIEMPKQGWVEENGTWYWYSAQGELANGWKQLSEGTWYYFDETGAMQTGWLQVENNWYYLSDSGVMQVGWKELEGNTYYLSEETGVMATGEVTIGDEIYVFDDNGVLQD